MAAKISCVKFCYLMALKVLCFIAVANAATPREVFSNSAVHLSFTLGSNSSSGSGFIVFRPLDASKVNEPSVNGQVFLLTNKHTLPQKGRSARLRCA